jgi:hypothetical protein
MEEAVDTERSRGGIAPIASEGVAHGSGDVERAGGDVSMAGGGLVVDNSAEISSEIRCFRILGIYGESGVDKRDSCLRSHLGDVQWLLCSAVIRKGRV